MVVGEPGTTGGGGILQPSLLDRYDTMRSASPSRQIWISVPRYIDVEKDNAHLAGHAIWA